MTPAVTVICIPATSSLSPFSIIGASDHQCYRHYHDYNDQRYYYNDYNDQRYHYNDYNDRHDDRLSNDLHLLHLMISDEI